MSIHIVAISGSVRAGSFTTSSLRVVADGLRQNPGVTVDLIDPATLTLPLPGAGGSLADVETLQRKVEACTGVILATPEYHGSYSSVIKLVIDQLGYPSMLAGKPIALLGVAAGAIGAVKALEHLRSVCSHVGALVLPGVCSIADVHQVFTPEGQLVSDTVEERLHQVGDQLVTFIHTHITPRLALEEMVRAREGDAAGPVDGLTKSRSDQTKRAP